ncbi:hypothetical protein B0H14DRAFT_2585165 [Mycena olivaceomarginata]|nr:hypothetical protein B0H14DRAFT_2585165 [Mycena olivaceomarginata]
MTTWFPCPPHLGLSSSSPDFGGSWCAYGFVNPHDAAYLSSLEAIAIPTRSPGPLLRNAFIIPKFHTTYSRTIDRPPILPYFEFSVAAGDSGTSADFGAAILDGRYAFRGRHSLEPVPHPDITNTVVEIVAQWLNFPASGKSRAQGWFIQAMFRECDPSTLYLDSVWFAFNHLESEVFGKLSGETPSSASYARLSVALQNCALTDPGSETNLVVKKIDALVTNYRTSRVAPGPPVPAVTSVPTAARRKTAAPVRSATAAGPHLLLTLADDATQQQNMAYLVELEPFIDGYGGSWGRLGPKFCPFKCNVSP